MFKLCLLSIHRVDLDTHPSVDFAGPEGLGKMHQGVGIEVDPMNTEQAKLGHPMLDPEEICQNQGGGMD